MCLAARKQLQNASKQAKQGRERVGKELQHLEQTAKQSEMFYLWALPGRGVECHMRCSNKTNNEAVSCFASIPKSPLPTLFRSFPLLPAVVVVVCQLPGKWTTLTNARRRLLTAALPDLTWKILRTSQTHWQSWQWACERQRAECWVGLRGVQQCLHIFAITLSVSFCLSLQHKAKLSNVI